MINIKYKTLLNIYESWESLSNNINEFKTFLTTISVAERNIIKNIIIFKKIKLLINESDNKNKILLPIYIKYKNKLIHRFYIFNILKLDFKTIRELNRELFKLKPIEEQKKIKEELYNKIKKRYHALTPEQKKIYNKNRINKKIKKMGYIKYKLYCVEMYKKWYHNLSDYKKKEYSQKRKERYINLPEKIKQKYKENKLNKLLSMPIEEKKYIINKNLQKRKEKINQMNDDDKKIYYEKLKLRKKIYFDNITIEKRKVINKIRTYKRQLNNNYISLDEFNEKKANIIKNNIKYL